MKELETRQDEKQHKPIKSKPTIITKSLQRTTKEKEEGESLTQKEIDKAYERISALEVGPVRVMGGCYC